MSPAKALGRLLSGGDPIDCYPSSRSVLLPINPVCTRVSGVGECYKNSRGILLCGCLRRTLVIERLAEDVEAALLRREAARRRARGLRLQGPVHPFMPAVLVRAPGLDELRQDAETYPPRREPRQAGQRGRGERHAVVAANPPRQPILVEQPCEDRFGLVAGRRRQGLATQEVAAEAIGHCQWIAVPAIPR